MAKFTRKPNGFIYMFHWFNKQDYFKISTKMKIEMRDWNDVTSKPKNSKLTYNDKNILQEMVRYESALHKALAIQPNFNNTSIVGFRELFKSILSPIAEKKPSQYKLLPYFKMYVENVRKSKQSNCKHYATCYKHLKNCLGIKKPTFEDVNIRFYKEFTDYLSSLNLSINTIANHTKLFKTVMNSAYLEGLHKNLLFKQFKIKTEPTDSIYLTEQELKKMYKLNLKGHLEIARDYFLVGAYTGLRFEDWNRVSSDIIVDGMLRIRATKTDELSCIPIHPYVKAILTKYGGTMPRKFSNQKMNEYIKLVAAVAKINDSVETRITKGGKKEYTTIEKWQLVSTHTAHRSLATNLISRGVSPYVVMRITGHKHLDNFDKYVRLRELEASIELKSIEFFN